MVIGDLRLDDDLAAAVHEEGAVRDALDRDALERLDRRHHGLAVGDVGAGDGHVAHGAPVLDAHEVDRAEDRARVADRAGDPRERPRGVGQLHADGDAVGGRRLRAGAHSAPRILGATCFLRLMTPGRSSVPSSSVVPEGALERHGIARHEHLGVLGEDVGDHQRAQKVVLALAQALERVLQLVAAIEDLQPDRLDLGDADRPALGDRVLLGVAAHDVVGVDARDVGGLLEHLAPEVRGVDGQHALEVVDDRVVALGRRGRVEDHGVRQHRPEQHRRRRRAWAPCRSGGSARRRAWRSSRPGRRSP